MSEWIDVRLSEAGNKLLFRFDPATDTIQIGSRRAVHEICLAEYRETHQRDYNNPLTFNAEGDRINTHQI